MAHHTCDYLIIGNSAAGVTAAEFLSAAAPDKSIIMVSHEPYRCYGRPLISYLLEGKTDREHLDYKSADFYEKRGIETLFGIEFEAVALDASAHEVKLAGGEEISYGKCLLATGSVPFIPPIPAWRAARTCIRSLRSMMRWRPGTMCSQQPSVRMRKAVKAALW